MNHSIRVIAIFPLLDEGAILAHLADFNWPFNDYGPAYLCIKNERIEVRYVGAGNINNGPVVKLMPIGQSVQAVAKLAEHLDHRARLEK